MGKGIGAFMDGFVSSAKAAEDRADKEWKREDLKRQEQVTLVYRQRRIPCRYPPTAGRRSYRLR